MRLILFALVIILSFSSKAQNGSTRKVLIENVIYGYYGYYDNLVDVAALRPTNSILLNYSYPIETNGYSSYGTIPFQHRGSLQPFCYPHFGYVDGICPSYNIAFNSWSYTPITTGHIDAAARIPSPFELVVSHSFSSAYDTMIIVVDIYCSRNIQGQDLRLRIAPVQNNIVSTLPLQGRVRNDLVNTNWFVAPDSGHYRLPNTWNFGDRMRVTYHWAMGSVHNIGNLSAICFIQDFQTSEVHQAEQSTTQRVPLSNAAITPITDYAVNDKCNPRFIPSVRIQNNGNDTIRRVVLMYERFTNQVFRDTFVGAILPGATASFMFRADSFASNLTNGLYYKLISVNDKPDMTPNDNETLAAYITRYDANSSLDSFETEFIGYERSYGFGNVTMNFNGLREPTQGNGFRSKIYSAPSNNQTDNVLQFNQSLTRAGGQYRATFTTFGVNNIGRGNRDSMVFTYACKPYIEMNWSQLNIIYSDSTKTDTFALQATTDCGLNWTTLWQKSGRDLMTTSFSDTSELAERHWRTVKASLAPVVGRIAHFRFVNLSHGMAQVYLDDIRIRPVPVIPPHTYTPSPYPNPTNGLLYLDLEFAGAGNIVQTSMFDALGRQVIGEVRHTLPAGLSTLSVDMSVLGNGYYYLVVNMPDGSKKSWPVSIVR